ncbi:MAG: hypothetical protein K2H64_07770, partial [Desulfovibrio sp.]|nr:hypothetical protein [Desulfovibrio sp.]
MIREFAIDPEVFSNFQNFRLLSDKFSVFNGRVISAFPKNWVARAVAALGKMPDGLRKSEIMAWLSPSPDRKHIFVKSGRAYDSEKLWLDNAVACEKKFFLILTAEAGDYVDREDILLIDENTALQNCEKFRIETSVLMPRTIDGFRATAGPLIKFSKTIIFVDPYFCASVSNRRAFGENLRSLLGLIDPGASVK